MTTLHASIANIPMPPRMARLPLTEKGFPALWFAAVIDGKIDLRLGDPMKLVRAIKERRCSLCGQTLGVRMAFVTGPMCCVTRTTSEAPTHYECAAYSMKACPFLSRPSMHRRDAGLPDDKWAPGYMVDRNPGVMAIWVARSYDVWKPPKGPGVLMTMGDPERVEWYAEGRIATRAEIQASILSGLPALEELTLKDSDPIGARTELNKQVAGLMKLVPA